MSRSILRYGGIAGALLFVPLFGPYLIFGPRTDLMQIGEIVGYSAMLLCMSATWFAMRAEAAQQPLPFGRLLAIGVGVSAVAALLFGLATWAFYVLAGDGLPDALMAYYSEQIRNSGASAAQIERELGSLEEMRPFFYNRPLQGALMAATVFVIGVAESLLGAAWLRWRSARAG